MKVKTSITISDELLRSIDAQRDQFKNRSQFIEVAIKSLLTQIEKEKREAADLAIINANADQLNEEAADALTYQVDL
jgi:metal-responsive CopG/Arc/MetJ family transcriptional regulator